ncbi:MAG: FtsX-like permease family protein [Cytophagales bacterium]|nr:FtsX-like permease family protein [Cytophagales bacterium]
MKPQITPLPEKQISGSSQLKTFIWGPTLTFSNTPQNSRDRLYILISIAVFVVVIAGINYVNLTTARAVKRAKEVGVRKVSGASQSNLIYQFLADALSVSFVAMFIAGLSVWSLLPLYRDFLGTNLPFDLLHDKVLLSSVLLIPLCFGLFAGSHPAFVLSSFKPVNILKGNFSSDSDGRLLRDGLTVFQFVISGALIFAVVVINQQLSFIEKHNPGYDREHILKLNLSDVGVREKKEILEEELRKHPNIANVSITSYFPNAVNTQQGREWKGVEGTTNVSFYSANADHHYLDVFNIKLVAGRNFSPTNPADKNAFLINETAARTYGWDDPVGMQFTGEGGDGDTVTIIGVIEDIHIANYRNTIKPFRIGYVRPWSSQLAIKIVPNDIPNTLAFIEDSYKKFATSKIPYSISFFDEEFGKVYKSDQQLSMLINIFSMIAALVACLGLYGLSVYTVSQRMKGNRYSQNLGCQSVTTFNDVVSKIFIHSPACICHRFACRILFHE